jgi:hypothetical protein
LSINLIDYIGHTKIQYLVLDIKLHAREHIIGNGIKPAYGQVANFWVPKTNSTTPVRSRYPVEFTKKSESMVTEFTVG